MPANSVHPVATSGVKQQQELLTVEEIEEDAGHVVLEPSPGGLNLRAKQMARGTRSDFGECEESWISADAAARATASEHDPYLLFGGDSSVARVLLKAAFLGDSRSGRYVQLVSTALYGGVLYPMVMHAIGFHFLSCVAVALLKGVNALCKVTGLRFQTFTDHGSADNPTVHVWRCAPASVREVNIVAVRRELTFGARIPGGGPHGEVAGLLMLLPLIIYSWPLMSNRVAGMTIVLGVLSFNIQLCVPCTLSILFMQSCATLAQSIDSVGIWQHQIGRGVPPREVDARIVDGGFKQAYTSFEIMSSHVHDFARSWTFYFFFAEFWLVIAEIAGGIAIHAEMRALLDARETADAVIWPAIYRLGVMITTWLFVMWFIVRVFCAAASISAACSRVLKRVHKLHASLAVHSPQYQDDCLRFHDHIERAGLGFRAMGFTITYHLGAQVAYPVVTAIGVVIMSYLQASEVFS